MYVFIFEERVYLQKHLIKFLDYEEFLKFKGSRCGDELLIANFVSAIQNHIEAVPTKFFVLIPHILSNFLYLKTSGVRSRITDGKYGFSSSKYRRCTRKVFCVNSNFEQFLIFEDFRWKKVNNWWQIRFQWFKIQRSRSFLSTYGLAGLFSTYFHDSEHSALLYT